MTREGWGWTLAVVFGAGLGVSWCRDRVDSAERAAAVARADTLEHLSDSLAAAARADSLAHAHETARLADSLRAIDAALATAAARATRLAGDIQRDTSSRIPRAQVLAALTAKDTLLFRQAVKLVRLAADTVAWRARWLGAARDGSAWHQIALEAQTQLAAANKRSAPKWGCTAGLSALAGGGLTVGPGVAVGPTLAVGLGASCGLHFRLP